MNKDPLTRPFETHVSRTLDLFELIRTGAGDSDKADHVRDELDVFFIQLSNSDRARVRDLSTDLNWTLKLANSNRVPESRNDYPKIAGRLKELYEAADWSGLLAVLRQHVPFLSLAQQAYMKGRAYDHLGQIRAALVFYRIAAELDAMSTGFLAILLHRLADAGHHEEAYERARAAITSRSVHRSSRILAAGILAKQLERPQGSKPIPTESLRQAVSEAIDEERKAVDQLPIVLATGLSILASLYEDEGNTDQALAAWNQLVQSPRTAALGYAGRGLFLARRGQTEHAVNDFIAACRQGVRMDFPYRFAAVAELERQNFGEAIRTSTLGLKHARDSKTKARLYEISAIAKAYFQVNPKSIKRDFEAALRLDPSNPRIERNFQVFLEALDQSLELDSLSEASTASVPQQALEVAANPFVDALDESFTPNLVGAGS